MHGRCEGLEKRSNGCSRMCFLFRLRLRPPQHLPQKGNSCMGRRLGASMCSLCSIKQVATHVFYDLAREADFDYLDFGTCVKGQGWGKNSHLTQFQLGRPNFDRIRIRCGNSDSNSVIGQTKIHPNTANTKHIGV